VSPLFLKKRANKQNARIERNSVIFIKGWNTQNISNCCLFLLFFQTKKSHNDCKKNEKYSKKHHKNKKCPETLKILFNNIPRIKKTYGKKYPIVQS